MAVENLPEGTVTELPAWVRVVLDKGIEACFTLTRSMTTSELRERIDALTEFALKAVSGEVKPLTQAEIEARLQGGNKNG